LYTEDNWLGDAMTRFAQDAGVSDVTRFLECLADPTPVPSIESDRHAAEELDGGGTPTLLFNGLLLRSGFDSTSIRNRIMEVQ
jgi:predicted DsbA family dithiol-disulfide isomerase